MVLRAKAGLNSWENRAPRRRAAFWLPAATLAIALAIPMAAQGQRRGAQPEAPVKTTYVRLTNNSNAILKEPMTPSQNERIIAINTHPDHANNFEYFLGRLLVARGYRVLEVNYHGPENTMEEFLPPIAAAVRYARTIPGVKTVVLAGHSGGGPELAFYQEVAEKGPSACQQPNRLYPCDGKNLADLPKADALMLLEANIGAPHRTVSIDPAVSNDAPKVRNPFMDMYAPQNGYDPKTNTASYDAAFLRHYFAALHLRAESLVAIAQAKLKAISDHTGPFNDDEPFVVAGMAENSAGARLNLADPKILAHTHAPHMELMADGTRPVAIVKMAHQPSPPGFNQRDTLADTAQYVTVRHFLSFLAVRTTPDFALTEDSIKGVDWRSSANSAPGSVENITVPTLVMAGSCTIHLIPLETVFDHSAAKDKEFVAVEGGDHSFQPCQPQFGDSQKRAMDYVESWLNKRF